MPITAKHFSVDAFIMCDPVSEDLLNRLLRGIYKSPMVEESVKEDFNIPERAK